MKPLPEDKYRKCGQHFRSGNDQELGVAVRQMVKMLEESGLTFEEAGAQIWGGGDTQYAELQKAHEQLKGQSEEVFEKCIEQEKALAAKDAEIERLKGQPKPRKVQYHKSAGEFVSYTWCFAPFRMAVVLILIAAWISGSHATLPRMAVYAYPVACIWLFILWCCAELDEGGWGVLLIKGTILGWAFAEAYRHPAEMRIGLGAVAVIIVPRLMNRLAKEAMKIPIIATIVTFFFDL